MSWNQGNQGSYGYGGQQQGSTCLYCHGQGYHYANCPVVLQYYASQQAQAQAQAASQLQYQQSPQYPGGYTYITQQSYYPHNAYYPPTATTAQAGSLYTQSVPQPAAQPAVNSTYQGGAHYTAAGTGPAGSYPYAAAPPTPTPTPAANPGLAPAGKKVSFGKASIRNLFKK